MLESNPPKSPMLVGILGVLGWICFLHFLFFVVFSGFLFLIFVVSFFSFYNNYCFSPHPPPCEPLRLGRCLRAHVCGRVWSAWLALCANFVLRAPGAGVQLQRSLIYDHRVSRTRGVGSTRLSRIWFIGHRYWQYGLTSSQFLQMLFSLESWNLW